MSYRGPPLVALISRVPCSGPGRPACLGLANRGMVLSKDMNAVAVARGFEQSKTKGVLLRAKDAAR